MKRILGCIIMTGSLIQAAYSQSVATVLGANYNHNPDNIDVKDLKRAGVNTVRITPRLYEFLNGEKNPQTDIGLERIKEAKSAGMDVIFGFRIDFKQNDERIPAPGSDRESEMFNTMRTVLENLGPEGVDIFTLGNEVNFETLREDLEFDENNQIPLVVFTERMITHLVEPLYAQEGWKRPDIYAGSFPAIFLPGNQAVVGNQELLKFANEDDRVQGFDLHFHLDNFEQVTEAFDFVDDYFTGKPFIVTEFSMHRLNSSKKNERIGINQAGIDWANKYGYDSNDLVRDFYTQMNTNQVEPIVLKEFFDTRDWHIPNYLQRFRELFSANNVLYATYPVLQQSAPSFVDEDTPVWFLNPLFMQVSLVRNELGLTSENPLCAEDFYDWAPLESEIILDALEVTGPVLIDDSKIVLHLTFDDNINDQSGNNHSVTLDVPGVSGFVDGKYGNAFSFDSTALTAGEADWWNPQQSFSIALWVRADQLPSVADRAFALIHQKDGGQNVGRVHAEILKAGDNPGSFTDGNRGDAIGFTAKPGEWFHFGVVVDREKGERQVYINGILNSSYALSSAESSNQPISIGANKGQAGSWFDGALDDLLITSEVLNELQIATLANGTVASSNLSAATIYESGVWSDGMPDAQRHAILNDNYTIQAGETLEVKSIRVGSDDTLTVASEGTLIVNVALSNEGRVIIEDGGTLVTFDKTVVGSVTLKKTTGATDDIPGLISTPVFGTLSGTPVSLNSFDESIGYDQDSGESRLVAYQATNPLAKGKGYVQKGTPMLTFKGIPNAGTITISGLTKTETGTTDPNHQGWHLLGNPYTTPLSIIKFVTQNELSGVYTWDGMSKGYVTKNRLGSVGTSMIELNEDLAMAEGFFIQVPSEGYSVEFSEDQRAIGEVSENILEADKLELYLEGDFYDEVLIGFSSVASIDLDQGLDATKFYGNEHISLYSLSGANKLAIQALPLLGNVEKRIKMGVSLDAGGSYQIGVGELTGLNNYNVFAVADGVAHNITNTPVELSFATGTNEFVLVLSQSATIDVNSTPVIENQSFSIDENSALTTEIGSIVASDLETSDLSYSITEGNENGAFQVGSSNGILTVANSEVLDFELFPIFNITITVSDGEKMAFAVITVAVNDINEAPILEDQSFSIEENSQMNAVIGAIMASDPESELLDYTIVSGNESGTFSLNNETGELLVADNTLLDFETSNTIEIVVSVSDGVLTSSAKVTIVITDIEDDPLNVMEKSEVVLYPNPASKLLQVFIYQNQDVVDIKILSIDGKQVLALVPNNKHVYDISFLPAGLYLVKVQTEVESLPLTRLVIN